MPKSKGISPAVSYVLAILLAVVVITGIATLSYFLYDLVLKDQIRRDLTQVGGQISAKINELYSLSKFSKSDPGETSAILLGELELNLPMQVAERNYRATLLSPTQIKSQISNITLSGKNLTSQTFPNVGRIVLETTQEPFVLVEYDVPGLNIELQGRSTEPSNMTLRYFRYNPNGTILDAIVMGDAQLISQITAVN